jgi:hypothetical protein
MYSVDDLRRAVESPKAVVRELNRLYHTRLAQRRYNPAGVDIFSEDWDNLVILDACRYDTFAERAALPGHLEDRLSRGASTNEFVRANFANRRQHDTVYITANSWYQRLRSEINAELHDYIDLHYHDEDGNFHSEEFKVVLPDVVTEQAERVVDKYPQKRIIIHYIQPHHPFIGPTGREHFTHDSSALEEVLANAENSSPELVWQAYIENLDIVLDAVEDLLPSLRGKTVVTSDHGEMLGDRHEFLPIRDFGHQNGLHNEVLTKVPWQVIDGEERREIVAEPPQGPVDDVDMDQLDERMKDLGYKM